MKEVTFYSLPIYDYDKDDRTVFYHWVQLFDDKGQISKPFLFIDRWDISSLNKKDLRLYKKKNQYTIIRRTKWVDWPSSLVERAEKQKQLLKIPHHEQTAEKQRQQRKLMRKQQISMKDFLIEQEIIKRQNQLERTKKDFYDLVRGYEPTLKIVKKCRYPYYFVEVEAHKYDLDKLRDIMKVLFSSSIDCKIGFAETKDFPDIDDFDFYYRKYTIWPAAKFNLMIYIDSIATLHKLCRLLIENEDVVITPLRLGYRVSKYVEFTFQVEKGEMKSGIQYIYFLPSFINEYKKLHLQQTKQDIQKNKSEFSKKLKQDLKPLKKKKQFVDTLKDELPYTSLKKINVDKKPTEIEKMKLLKDIEKGKKLRPIRPPKQLLEEIKYGKTLKPTKTDPILEQWIAQLDKRKK